MDNVIYAVGELLNLLEKYQFQFGHSYRGSGFIFRGMSNKAWPLLPGIFREYSEPQKSTVVESDSISGRIYSSHENEIIAHFKKESSGFLPQISQNDDFTWIQYAQHFGVPTRLLDFTKNPLVALYFCCQSESNEDGIVWFINTTPFQNWSTSEFFCSHHAQDCTRALMINSILESVQGYIDDGSEKPIEKQFPVFFIPAYIDQRMSAQSSCFLLWGKNEVALESMIEESNKMSLSPDDVAYSVAEDKRFLANIIIPKDSKHSIMRELDLLGVNEKTVFPGLDGIGRYLERYYKQNADDICMFL